MKTKEIAPFSIIYYSQTTSLRNLHYLLALQIDEKLRVEAFSQQIEIVGPIMWNYYGTDGNPDTEFRLEIAYPVNRTGKEGEFKFKALPEYKSISVLHKGAWSTLGETYGKVIPQMLQNKLQIKGNCREIYSKIVSPASEENITEIQIEYN